MRKAPPPLCLTGVVCDTQSISITGRGTLRYTVFRPGLLEKARPPLVCIAGGPLLSSSYLNPIVHGVTDRSVVLYDAIGCGSSQSNVTCVEATKIEAMVHDLAKLLDRLPCQSFYLLGHSFGGILAYEYVKKKKNHATARTRCRGVVLVSTPVSLQASRDHSKQLLRAIANELDTDDADDTVKSTFHLRHECRVTPIPLPLQQALINSPMLSQAASSRQTYQAPEDNDVEERVSNVPVLVLRGQNDFTPEQSCRQWLTKFETATYLTLAGCSHYSMLEDDALFSSVVSRFVEEHD